MKKLLVKLRTIVSLWENINQSRIVMRENPIPVNATNAQREIYHRAYKEVASGQKQLNRFLASFSNWLVEDDICSKLEEGTSLEPISLDRNCENISHVLPIGTNDENISYFELGYIWSKLDSGDIGPIDFGFETGKPMNKTLVPIVLRMARLKGFQLETAMTDDPDLVAVKLAYVGLDNNTPYVKVL